MPKSDAVAVVVDSRDAAFPVGSTVVGLMPWAGLSEVAGDALHVVDPEVPAVEHLTIRGHVGHTAYAALAEVGGLSEGETVWISAAAGGVGTCAVQMARALGGRVVASAGGPDRVGFLRRELGVEHVLDRRDGLEAQLDEAAPDGLDVYIDLVGGDHLELALSRMRERGRVVLVGRSAATPRGEITVDHSQMIRQRITLSGMSVTDHPDARAGMISLVEGADPAMKPAATVRHGADAIASAFADVLQGRILGRAVVDVRDGRGAQSERRVVGGETGRQAP